MEIEKLNEWNPWWENPSLVEPLIGKIRKDYELLVNSTEIREITIITGIRRSGKSTLMYQMIYNLIKKGVSPKEILFVNLEDRKLTKDSLEEIYQAYRANLNPNKKAFIFFDEIHKREGWESWIRKKYDLKTEDKFIISGSCSYLLKKEYSTLLTGRNLTFDVFPLSFEEFLLFNNLEINKENLKKKIILDKTKYSILNYFKGYLDFGGFPEIVLKEKEYQMKLLKQYFDDILFKDIVDRYNLNSQKTEELALFLITNFTNLISLRRTRNSLKIAYDTIKDYLSYFKEASLFFTLDQFSYSFNEQKTAASKVYCIDNGLRNAVAFKFSKDEGRLVENLVFIELKRREKEIFYWRGKGEVDFVVKNSDNSLTAINVTYSDDIEEREIKGLLEFKEHFNKCENLVLLTKDSEREEEIEGRKIIFRPIWKWLLEER